VYERERERERGEGERERERERERWESEASGREKDAKEQDALGPFGLLSPRLPRSRYDDII